MNEAELMDKINEFCDDHQSSLEDDNADYDFDVVTFHNWLDAIGTEEFKASVPDNDTLCKLIEKSSYPELSLYVPN